MLMVPDTIGEKACKRICDARTPHTHAEYCLFVALCIVITVPNFVCYLADDDDDGGVGSCSKLLFQIHFHDYTSLRSGCSWLLYAHIQNLLAVVDVWRGAHTFNLQRIYTHITRYTSTFIRSHLALKWFEAVLFVLWLLHFVNARNKLI